MAHRAPLPLADDPVPPPSPSHTHSSACSSRSLAHEGGDLHSLSSRDSDWSSSSSDGAEEAFDMVSSAELPPPVSPAPRDEAQQNARSLSPGSAASSDAGGSAPPHAQRMRLSFPDPLETSLSPAEQEQEPARGHEREGARSILLDGEGAYSLLLDAPRPRDAAASDARESGGASGLTSPLLRAQGREGEGDVEGVEEWVKRMRDAQDGARESEGRGRTERGVQATLGEAGGAAAEDEGVVAEKAEHADAPTPQPDLGDSAALLSASVVSTTTAMAGSSLVSSQATVVPSTVAAAPVVLAVTARTATPTPAAVTAAETKPAAHPPLASQRGSTLAYRAFASFCVLALMTYCLSAAWLDRPPGLRPHSRPREVVREVRVEAVVVGTPDPVLAMRGEMMGESTATGAAFGGETLQVKGLPTDTTVQIDFVPACATPTASSSTGLAPLSHTPSPPSLDATSSAACDTLAVVHPGPVSAAALVPDCATASPSTATESPCAACALATLPAAHPPVPLAHTRHSKRCAHARERRRPRVVRRGEKGASKDEGERVSLFRETAPPAERAGLASLAELALTARKRVRDVRDLQARARAVLRAEGIIGAVDVVCARGGTGVARAVCSVRAGGVRVLARLERFASLRPELLGNKLDRMTVTAHDRDSLVAIARSLAASRVAQLDAAL
ncbi:hypothetical protein JCM10449v2_007150, partial [Rhodotorula kratochvilovae]